LVPALVNDAILKVYLGGPFTPVTQSSQVKIVVQ
jgi:hypothetical protein